MSRTITIAPVTRIEGHAAITIHLDDAGQVAGARLHVHEFRGFESFCVGRPFWEMPAITARICGICPVSHALAAAMAGDQIIGAALTPAARNLRALLSLAQLILSHSLSFFHLSLPDIVLGLDADPAERSIAGLARHSPELIRKGIRLRQIGQEMVNRIAGGQLHPEFVVPGGMREPLSAEGRDALSALLPEALGLVRFAFGLWHEHKGRFQAEMGRWEDVPGLHLGLVGTDGRLDHYSGRLRFTDHAGAIVRELEPEAYAEAIRETAVNDSYLKPTSCTCGGEEGLYRVGPLARLIVADFSSAPQASRERDILLSGKPVATLSLGHHHARLVEMLYAVERMGALLADPAVCDSHVLARADVSRLEGVGVTEAPRG
ncbi:MAG TPA: Ni/Fe hydrogenase subunit alpha, partial [Desulfuromonadaceae bacterium]